ncbi:3-methyl-2-oxobutanoate hydroxymethyltransferase [Paeniglutamicibacter cryotolerans]|uniref:3-methyl-2-oxobutanoate hydroxymethyltransferase n=1 Tax=Paeniglutamicibacter cryotolerans TaxID=670079 RepID=A0A839QKB5_9MICC|nr:3-methyl-2-oxobutanoate hydroxymethyltransferase [Paeniglutamicibacter cryotolerans]MBB2996649.1 3-methyl-2-oxobutanoate hydroxymethyltransferase [Paeniglutamicibacter cryotolerans]
MSEQSQAPYGQNTSAPAGTSLPSRVRIPHLARAKAEGRHFAMLTAYDCQIASIFDEAGIEVLLVGDSAASTMMGASSTLPITMEEMIVFARSVVAGTKRALVVCDMPFGSYEVSVEQAVANGIRLLKEAGVHAVKLEGGARYAPHVEAMTAAGVPVMGHIGFTPQSEHVLGGYRIQGRGEAAQVMIDDALALQDAGSFCVLMEMVPTEAARAVDAALRVPTIGIGAGPVTTGQVLVWQDMLGLGSGRNPRFVKKYAELRPLITSAAAAYLHDVHAGTFPGPEHGFE